MIIYLIDEDKIQKYVLPKKIESSFLVDYISTQSNTNHVITIEAENNQWYLRNNGNINVINSDGSESDTAIKLYVKYDLKILGQDKFIHLYALPLNNKEIYTLDYSNVNEILVGKDQKCNIIYNDETLEKVQFEIVKKDNLWFLNTSSSNVNVYLNNTHVTKAMLKIGDVIFINGLKIIWMKDFIKINNPKKAISVVGLNPYKNNELVNNAELTPVSDEEATTNLYDEDDYFFHSPQIRERVEKNFLEIDSPPTKETTEELPLLLSMGTSIVMLGSASILAYNVVSGFMDGDSVLDMLPQIIMLSCMVIGSLVVPRLVKAYNKRRKKAKEKLRQKKYKVYLEKKESEINNSITQQSSALFLNYPSSEECMTMVYKNKSKIWNRQINETQFLKIRLGLGDIHNNLQIKAPQEKFTIEEDNLFQSVYDLVKEKETIHNVPITFSLTENTNFAFTFYYGVNYTYINGLVAQITSLHSASDVKIVILTDKENKQKWDYMKFMPHIWSDDKKTRFFATNQKELQSVANYLDEEYKKRLSKIKEQKNQDVNDNYKKEDALENGNSEYKAHPPYYIILCDNYKSVKKEPMIDTILKANKNIGFTFVTIAKNTRQLPSNCETFIEVGQKDGAVLSKEIDSKNQTKFSIEDSSMIDMRNIAASLANIPLLAADEESGLPNSLTFLEMFNVSKIEQLNILNRWKENDPVINLSAPVGVKVNGELFNLDLHEKFHGPHGLIAGSTGSGKSEFIITYILSMAVNYHPYEAQFVLIDYKGGGLAGAFENKETGVHIPHLAGTITNLDNAEMNRALVSIESELKRRQRIFNEVKDSLDESTIDIYKYQRLYREGVVKEPLAHLFIISDEFAELKKQQPEFMDQLISTARIGRSLGVHLVLATQKPSGVVNDQIWSNSKFKVCLKVQDRSDSMEVLKKPDAASIKEVGRFYLQVGYDDYFAIGQSGWGGAKYVPTTSIMKKVDDSISFINNVGYSIKTINDAPKEKEKEQKKWGDQLTNTVKHIYNLAQSEGLKTHQLWLDNIPDTIYLENLKAKYSYKPEPFYINPVIGEADKPKKQKQELLNLDLTNGGNTLIYGQSGSGKEMLLSSIIWSTALEHRPSEVNFYIVDCGAETLKVFNKMPHVGEVTTIEDEEKVINIFVMISDELKRRKDLFSDFGGSYNNYIKNSGEKLPLIIIVINNFDIFVESFRKLSEGIDPMYRDCSKYGINFIISLTATNAMRIRARQNFNNKITLQLPSDGDHRSIIQDTPRGLVPARFKGRGLIEQNDEVFEFQTARIYEEGKTLAVIKNVTSKLNEAYKERALKIRIVPDEVSVELMLPEVKGLNGIPLGFNTETKEIYKYNFSESTITPIIATTFEDKIEFIYALVKEIKTLQKVVVVDFLKLFNKNIENVDCYQDDYMNVINAINEQVTKDEEKETPITFVIIGLGAFVSHLKAENKQVVSNIFKNASSLKNIKFILVDNYSIYKNIRLEPWFSTEIDSSSGVWVGEGIGAQTVLNVFDLDSEIRNMNYAYMGFAINKGKVTPIKCVFDEEE